MVNIGDLLSRRAHLNPDKHAYIDSESGDRFSFETLDLNSNRLANAFLADGIQSGDRVALLLRNGIEFLETFFALAKIGAVTVPLNWRLAPGELAFILEDSGSETLVFDTAFNDSVQEFMGPSPGTKIQRFISLDTNSELNNRVPANDYETFKGGHTIQKPALTAGDNDILFIMYTSGTTGKPKGAVHSHKTTFWSILTFSATHDLQNSDTYLAALPMFHVGALTPLIINVYVGATSVVMRSFDPALAWQLMVKERVTTALLVPAMLNFMLQTPEQSLSGETILRWIQVGAAPVPVQLIEQYASMGIEIHQIYGLTESCGPACIIDGKNALKKIGSTGKGFFHTDIKVVDVEGFECPANSPGELWVRGEHIMLKYWNQPAATSDVLVDGWLKTGDIAYEDEDGYIYIQDRLKDMIISGGENIYPAELENIILSHSGVKEVAVIGQPSDRWGESPFAVVVRTRDDVSESAILEYCQGKVANYKLPKGTAFVEEIPRNPSGKILKRQLRQLFPGPAKE